MVRAEEAEPYRRRCCGQDRTLRAPSAPLVARGGVAVACGPGSEAVGEAGEAGGHRIANVGCQNLQKKTGERARVRGGNEANLSIEGRLSQWSGNVWTCVDI